ncbi:helix-turn-helix domain-containing protein [Exiguobacterium sp. TDN 0502]|uniref:helix-turn-helix domain-containing protein n=1 Tax=Exiguobacterium sp. TDN 0502 TaxID=3420731 RepID=UPI003D77660B
MQIQYFGQRIRELRVERNWTQKELALGVCSQAELSKIENGKIMPTMELVLRLSQKLHITMEQLFIDMNELKLFRTYDVYLSDLSRKRRYDEMLSFVEGASTAPPPSVNLLLRYFKWIAKEGRNDIDYRTCISQLLRLSDQEQVEREYPIIYLRIRMSVANYYYLNGHYPYARKIYEDLLSYQYATYDLKKLQCKVIYNHAQQLYFQHDYGAGLDITEKGIALSTKRKDTAMLGHFYYQRGCFFEKLHYPEQNIRDAFTLAYTLFHAFDNTNHAQLVSKGKRNLLYFEF